MSTNIPTISNQPGRRQNVRNVNRRRRVPKPKDLPPAVTWQSKPLSLSIANKYRHLLDRVDRYDKFVAKMARRYGAFISKIRVETESTSSAKLAKGEPLDVTYIRKSRYEDHQVKEVIKKVAPAVVQVRGWGNRGGWSGSGAIVDLSQIFPKEHFPPGTYGVLTNNHVTPPKETKYLTVTLADGTVLKNVKVLQSKTGKTTTQDKIVDVSLIIIQSNVPLPTLDIAKEPPRMGETVLTAGHPLGLSKASFTRGIVSHNSQETGEPTFVIQHDAEINPGNSGGPLINMQGEILGLNTFTFRGSNGLSFAIPIQTQVKVLRNIYKYGEQIRGDLGFTVSAFTTYERVQNKFPLNLPGAKINWVDHNSQAYKMGLRPNDVITQIVAQNGSTFNINIDNPFEVTRFLSWMHKQRPGTAVHMVVYRYSKKGGEIKYTPETVELKVGKLGAEKKSLKSDTWGFLVQKDSRGLAIITQVDPGSPAEKKGIKPGRWALIGIAAKEISAKPMAINDLNMFKKALIMLRESEAKHLILYVADRHNPKVITHFVLSREEIEQQARLDAARKGIENYIAA